MLFDVLPSYGFSYFSVSFVGLDNVTFWVDIENQIQFLM